MTAALTEQLETAESAFAAGDAARALDIWRDVLAKRPRGFDIGGVLLRMRITERLISLDQYRSDIAAYNHVRSNRRPDALRIAVYSCITGDYDSLKMPVLPDPRLDYVLFTDRPRSGGGVWQMRPLNTAEACEARASRYVKMNPHRLLPEYDIAVWVDANIMLSGDILPMVETFLTANEAIGAVRHPHRSTIYEEVEACILQQKEKVGILREQVAYARKLGFAHDDLVEANFLMFKLRDPRAVRFLTAWWAELERFSRRDQLGFNLAMQKAGTAWHRLIDRPRSARNHPDLIYVPHDKDHGPASVLIEALQVAPSDPWALPMPAATLTAQDICVVDVRTSAEAAAALARSTAVITILKDPALQLTSDSIAGLARTLMAAPACGIAIPRASQDSSILGRDPHIPAGSRMCMAVHKNVPMVAGFPDDGYLPGQIGWDIDLCFRAADHGQETRLASCVVLDLPQEEQADGVTLTSVRQKLIARHGRHRLARAAKNWRRISPSLTGMPQALVQPKGRFHD